MKNVIKLKRKGYLGLTNTCGQKPLEKLRKKMTKRLRLDQSRKRVEKKIEKDFESMKNT